MMSAASNSAPASRLPNRLAAATFCATFPLIWVGGLVTTTEAGMAVPDWPNTFGYNLLLYPWTTWIAGPWDIFVEHGHRLFAVGVGMLTIALLWSLWKFDDRRWMRVLGVIALIGVVGQGAIGGMRVLLDERLLAMTHACVGPLFFTFCVVLWHFTTSRYRESESAEVAGASPNATIAAARLYPFAFVTAALAYVQLIFGAFVRHTPASAPPSAFRAAVLLHLAMAALLSVHIVVVAVRSLRPTNRVAFAGFGVRGPAWLMSASLIVQLALGGATWVVNYGFPSWVAAVVAVPEFKIVAGSLPQVLFTTAHVAVGSLIVAAAALLSARLQLLAAGAGSAAVASRRVVESSGRTVSAAPQAWEAAV